MAKQTIRDVDVWRRRVLVRVDYNVPVDEQGRVTDSTRIRETFPTLSYLRTHGARIVLVSHLGRPDGKKDPKLSLAPVASELSELMGSGVPFAWDTIGPDAQMKAAELRNGDILLVENVRFEPGEEKNDPEFAKALAQFGDVFVNDAFGTAHRAHASTTGVAAFLPAVAGLLMEKELLGLGKVLEDPARPLVAVIGGAKVSSKIGVLAHLLPRVDRMVIGGGMACTFLKAQGFEVGRSLVEDDQLGTAADLITRAGDRLLLPVDGVCVERVDRAAEMVVLDADKMTSNVAMVDIGPKSIERFREAVEGVGTIVWNGPMGIFEMERFAEGTAALAAAIAGSGATTVVGGGDTVAAIEKFSNPARFTHVSTGGGASLEFLEGRELPGVAALLDRQE